MEIVNLDLKKRYTFADYLGWMDDKRRELFNGFVKMMTPAPSTKHQQILGEIHGQFWHQLKKQKCKIFPAPFDVRFPSKEGDISDDKIYTVVQPDISIICDHSKIDGKGCIGAPDLIIEIISPNTVKNDVGEKFRLYEQNSVREYWIIHPNDETVSVFILENGKYQLQGIYTKSSKIKVRIFEQELLIDLTDIFSE